LPLFYTHFEKYLQLPKESSILSFQVANIVIAERHFNAKIVSAVQITLTLEL
jgi:hypothetical protein